MKKLLTVLLFIPLIGLAQDNSKVHKLLEGYWEGAFVKNNSFQKIQLEVSIRDNSLYALQIMDEWHPTYGEFEVPVSIDSLGKINFGTGYGMVQATLDQNNLEMIGAVAGYNPSLYIHLKKAVSPPAPLFNLAQVNINSGEQTLFGHLHLPDINRKKTAIIIVGGRGCGADQTKYNLYAKFFRKYGIATLAYQKRGTGNSNGNCETATIEELAEDLVAAKKYLDNHEAAFESIGVLGISAGGWTMLRAEEDTDFDFMISVVGPATSVRDQQLQSAAYGAGFYGLEAEAKANLLAYTELMFDAPANARGFQKLQELLVNSEEEGWKQLLEGTDIAKSAGEIDQLWVRRHNYDPASTLNGYGNPFLGIYGERDWIVPPEENIELLKRYFRDRLEILSTVEAYDAEHGMEMQARTIDLGANQSYWHFYRISPDVRIAIHTFLLKHNFIQ